MSVHYHHAQRASYNSPTSHTPFNYHNHHNPLNPLHPIQSAPRSRIYRHAPSTSTLTTTTFHNHPLTPFELLVLLFALGILVSLLSWVTWILLEYCITFAKEQYDDMSYRRAAKRNARRPSEDGSGIGTRVGMLLGKMGLGTLSSMFTNREERAQREDGDHGKIHDEGKGLLGPDAREEGGRARSGSGSGARAGYGGYGYHEGMMYPALLGGERPRYADGISESSGSVGPMDGHSESFGDVQPRRRSRDL